MSVAEFQVCSCYVNVAAGAEPLPLEEMLGQLPVCLCDHAIC